MRNIYDDDEHSGTQSELHERYALLPFSDFLDDDVLPADTAKLHMLIKDLQHKLETAKDVGFTQMSILNQDLRDLEEEKVMACNIHDDTMVSPRVSQICREGVDLCKQ